MKKKIKLTVWMITISLLIAAVLFVLQQHSFSMTEQKIEIDTPQGQLTGTLVLPESYSGTVGLVVFVHGDGPVNDTYDDGYKPLWEKLASAGYASLSLNKPGIGGSSGNWLEQSMEDRAQETIYAINWAKALPMIDAQAIGLWGASQAGWVIPKIVKKVPDLAFSILVSPAIQWISQGQYNTRQEMILEGFSEQEIKKREDYNAQILLLLKEQASYEKYLRIAQSDDLISKEKWGFFAKNYQSDASGDLKNFTTPVHLVLGGQDINVDVEETERVYREKIPENLLSVFYIPDADHSMLSKKNALSPLRTYLTAVFFPRHIVVEPYLDDLVHFVSQF
ncbi:alpha/beta hydrolase [Paenibacillus odorifer]|uniref:alpha/beta hydrolase family protein n=1 Tax=Paenibacillus TaxID=44249 RepID=UPI00096D9C8C|nr:MULTISPECIES: alpha/beta hydrolase [Paenibacillus]MDH6428336.1 dipeptidyl aminopeptidase/acylaminoacyl peptidase [Paenibacillus sp. PastH-4]MDH6444031.1 dipeptidyl aminopeptidase/acylaminoacyl peptidase [Paenibacillus sp. PastF-4]MDH6527935.1 dipeptidyl aminopeptidase/acylaminoacyl peptidase [Paenibacillus sp. PastH-3]OMC78870.1 alpha/beta hydrolase [Paenibacillus odorifer]OMD59537.1 alpha/beta hydrolase [Paenibacillus odorifer]